ncbi:Smr/MutS family protein [Jiella pacifica]|uniref:DNA mismatch repair protein MutS n=1 Tax=Jiella pacifica TaxID=2696469 RepID=A0A6N9T050_9HYPH|nr:Smr/MutS family protein [Jiella pacifica]NDW04704.1 DNA mismatch repair protein MutS [Jiella pacifica]
MKRRRILSEEDRRLWATVARQAVPLKGRAGPNVDEPVVTSKAKTLSSPTAPADAAAKPAVLPQPSKEPRKTAAPPPPQHPIERPTRRKLAKGRLPIEARLDLHEMTQLAAHAALARFLAQAQAMGLRHVLVITGRGMPGGSRGILRRVVPQWFASPQFRGLVSGFESAERHHGGDGALYVRVRRVR